MSKWIGRNKRGHKTTWTKHLIWLLVPIAVFLVIFAFGDKISGKITSLYSARENKPTPAIIRRPLDTDSLLYSIILDLGLDSSQLTKDFTESRPNQKKTYPRYLLKWPRVYPFVWFTRNVQLATRGRDSLRYDATEFDNGQKLDVILSEMRDTLGIIELTADSRCKPAVSTAAIIFDNFNILTKSQIMSLVKLGLPFGYILSPDQAPENDISKILKTCRGECYLRLPTDKESWAAIMKRTRGGNSGKTGKPNDKYLESIFRRFPIADGFFFDDAKGVDKIIVKSLVKQASALNLFYVDLGKKSASLDTILMENGVKIGIPIKKVDLQGVSSAEFISRFKADFGRAAVHPKIIYVTASRADYIKAMEELVDFRSNWNIRMAPPSAQMEIANAP